MNNKLFFTGLYTIAMLTTLLLQASAQDSIKHTAVVKPVYKSKTATVPTGTPPRTTTYPAKTVYQKPVPAANGAPATPAYKPPYAQPAVTPVAPTDRSINGQYQYLLSKTYGYQRPMIAAFYKGINDTLNFERKKIKPLQTSLAALRDTVKTLHTQLASQEQTLNESSTKVDSISLLGIKMTKSAYNMLMWGLVIAFGAVAAFVVVRSGSYSREAKYRIKLYDDLDEEYKSYKAKANEKEKKLARELQTARNKLEELTGNPGY